MERYLLAIAAFASECVDEHLSGGTASKGTERNDGTERMLAKASLPLKHERTRISALPVGKCFISSGVDRWRWEIADYRFELRPLGVWRDETGVRGVWRGAAVVDSRRF